MADRGELLTVADDEVVVWHGPTATRLAGLRPGSPVVVGGIEAVTLPRRGELLCRIATVNDVHFGEVEAGRMGDGEGQSTFSVPEGAEPYPEVMSRGAVHDIGAWDPDLVVAKGDLTAGGTMEQYRRFAEVYRGAFGDRLVEVRGNHESYHGLRVADAPVQERELPGVTVAVLDTSRDGRVNGDLDADQLAWLDELGARADRPVLVFGHHPVWDAAVEPRTDDTFGLVPDATDALAAVFGRRRQLLGYFAGHTHRNRVRHISISRDVPWVEVACVKDFPGAWAEYRVHEGGLEQVFHRISTPDALVWTEQTRQMFAGLYADYAFGELGDRCFTVPAHRPS